VSGQHVGRQSDALDGDDDLSAAMRERMKIKPTGKVFRGVSDLGDGDRCPVEGHGKMFVLSGGTQWCPNQTHDNERIIR
jgi:hypothetical protein